MKKQVVTYKAKTRYMYHLEVVQEKFELEGKPPYVQKLEKVEKFR